MNEPTTLPVERTLAISAGTDHRDSSVDHTRWYSFCGSDVSGEACTVVVLAHLVLTGPDDEEAEARDGV